jgi:hypothetical protein
MSTTSKDCTERVSRCAVGTYSTKPTAAAHPHRRKVILHNNYFRLTSQLSKDK